MTIYRGQSEDRHGFEGGKERRLVESYKVIKLFTEVKVKTGMGLRELKSDGWFKVAAVLLVPILLLPLPIALNSTDDGKLKFIFLASRLVLLIHSPPEDFDLYDSMIFFIKGFNV